MSAVGGARSPIPLKDLFGPRKSVLDPNAGWLGSYPKLQVHEPVVVSDAVPVMYGLIAQEIPPKLLLYDQNVLENVRVFPGAGMARHAHHDVTSLVIGTTAAPVLVLLGDLRATLEARVRLALLRPSTRTGVAGTTCRAADVATRWLEASSALGARLHD